MLQSQDLRRDHMGKMTLEQSEKLQILLNQQGCSPLPVGGAVSNSLPCPACKLGSQQQGFEFDGGYLHLSVEYRDLLHCNYCGAYYHRANYAAPLRRIRANELREYRI